jgi:hypothetical protein
MPKVFENDILIVKQGWIGPWRVVDKRSGATVAPDMDLKVKLGLTWPKVRRRHGVPPDLRLAAENYMFFSFGLAAIQPNGPVADLFRATEPDELADAIYLQAESILYGGRMLTPDGGVPF